MCACACRFSGDDIRKTCESIARYPGTKLEGPLWFQWTERGKLQPVDLVADALAPCEVCANLEWDPEIALQECTNCHAVRALWANVPELVRDPAPISMEDAYDVVQKSRSTAPSAADLAKFDAWAKRS